MAEMTPCGIGYYSPPLSIACSECKPGYYCDSETTSEEDMLNNKVCPEGTNCDEPGGGENPELVHNSCPLGYYCLPGDQNDGQPVPCPIGTFGAEMGLTSPDEDLDNFNQRFCTPCPEGKFCPSEGGIPNCEVDIDENTPNVDGIKYPCKAFSDCTPGHYCPERSSEEEQCPEGYYQPFPNQVDENACAKCISGYFCDTHELTNPISCPANYFCPSFEEDGEINRGGIQHPCPKGTYSLSQNLRTESECPPWY